jgi:glycosyltransferase involved in cell wall biosynthesis
MKILLVTEKCGPTDNQRDGGARLVETLQRVFGDSLQIMQFGSKADPSATWHFDYPFNLPNRFERRLANARFIAEHVKVVEHSVTHVIFAHISMQFGLIDAPLRKDLNIWTFPMFLTPSYRASGEIVPESYFQAECVALAHSNNILTPSHLEKRQLINIYGIPSQRIHVIPRGVNTQFLTPKVRTLEGSPIFCSIGSIKPQKNILGLVNLFSKIKEKFPISKLRVIGPVQDTDYFSVVQAELQHLELADAIDFKGYLPPNKLSFAIDDAHIHISTSTCETFGRSIFETLASGIPNIARATDNAAAEVLKDLPYVRFIDDHNEALKSIEVMLNDLEKLSSMALGIGILYDDEMLSQLLAAKICNKDIIAVSDFDGTLFHKDDTEKTQRCIDVFSSFPKRVICSARPLSDLLAELRGYNLEVDWIVGCGGSIVANGNGKPLWVTPLQLDDVAQLEAVLPQTERIELEGKILQLVAPAEKLPRISGVRIEIYQDTAFIAHWDASKLRAVHQLLRHINWSGQVHVFGDGLYDSELITYFDGILITPTPTSDSRQRKEITHA